VNLELHRRGWILLGLFQGIDEEILTIGVWVMKRDNGFTLIELMIVITIIAIIAAIGLPNFLRARVQANEVAAIGSLRTITSGQVSYHSVNLTYGTFADLLSRNPPWIDGTWTDGYTRNGYVYEIPVVEKFQFTVYAEPAEHLVTGERYFMADHTGAIHYNNSNRATVDDPVIPNAS
jgi:prepilin-type N-terminal cleavage/methylation domain-containing protein